MEMLTHETALIKIFIMPEGTEYTYFQGFDVKLNNLDYLVHLEKVALLPWDVKELFLKREELIDGRELTFQNQLILISESNFNNISMFFENPFVILFSTQPHDDFIFKNIEKFRFKPIVVSNDVRADIQWKNVINTFSLDDLIFNSLRIVMLYYNSECSRIINKLRGRLRKKTVKFLDFESVQTGSTFCNEMGIKSYGYDFKRKTRLSKETKRQYITRIFDTINLYNKIAKKRKSLTCNDLTLYATGMYGFFYNKDNEFLNLLNEKLDSEEKNFIVNGLFKNPGYSSVKLKKETLDELSNKGLKPLILSRMLELRLTHIALTFVVLKNQAPALRLPNEVHFHVERLKVIEKIYIEHGSNSLLFKRRFCGLMKKVRRSIGSKITSYVTNSSSSLTAIIDFPIEWVTFDSIPLMFTHEISRNGVTPGNILLQNCTFYPEVTVQGKELLKVLVVRSFDVNDHLKHHLELALDIYGKNYTTLKYEIVDVASKNNLIDVLNEYKGYIVIFDCHGNHGGNKEHAWLSIGQDNVDVWELRKIARIPPIVILSACLTSPVSGSHASVANGFLTSGALSVISTLLPVNSAKSAAFIGRILLRIDAYVDMLYKMHHETSTWRTFVSQLFKMSFVTDILMYFVTQNIITNDHYEEIHLQANLDINTMKLEWYENLIDNIVECSKQTKKEILYIIQESLYFTETMCYTQMGKPENIIIDFSAQDKETPL